MKVFNSEKITVPVVVNESRRHFLPFTTVPKSKGLVKPTPYCIPLLSSRQQRHEVLSCRTSYVKGNLLPSYVDTFAASEFIIASQQERYKRTIDIEVSKPSPAFSAHPIVTTVETESGGRRKKSFCGSSSDPTQPLSSRKLILGTRKCTTKGKAEPVIQNHRSVIQSPIITSAPIHTQTTKNSGIKKVSHLEFANKQTYPPNRTSTLLPFSALQRIGGISFATSTIMKGKGNRHNSAVAPSATSATTSSTSSHQVSSGGQPGTPRTPGTPSDAGGNTPNPPTPGNNNSNSMVGSSPQYVPISVEDGAVSGENGVGGGNSSYPMYTVGESATVYGPGTSSSSQYYAAGSANGSAFKRKKSVPELCPIPVSTQRPRQTLSPKQEFYEDETDMMMEDVDDTDESYAVTSVNAVAVEQTLSELVYGLDDHGTSSSYDEEAIMHQFGDQLMYPPSTNCNRTNPLTVTWLLENYENAEGVSLPRSTLYNHYLRHCSENKIDPVNAASFGKLIRSVFLGLRTRRLGTRGNSKYHYYGIRLKPSSLLNHMLDDEFPINESSNGHHNGSLIGQRGNTSGNHLGNSVKRFKPSSRNDLADGNSNGFAVGDTSVFVPYLGNRSGALTDFPELEAGGETFPDGVVDNDLFIFRTLYREHCKVLLDLLSNFQLSQFEISWKSFWRGGDSATVENGSVDFEKILPKSKMIQICKMNAVEEFIKKTDYSIYQHIVETLLPEVLRPIPSAMTQAIRNFAKVLENWVSTSMNGYPDSIVALRVCIVSSLAQTLRRYTSLNHLAQAARAVLQNQNQISQMLADLNRVDFRNVEEQASWVCGCVGDAVPSLEADFKATLSQQQTLDQWGQWLENVVDKMLKPHENSPNFIQEARHFLLKWSFYSSLIIRDLTLRSAASFGSFHLLRLLYDEYIFYLIEHIVAKATGMVPIEVIGKKIPAIPFTDYFQDTSDTQELDSADEHSGEERGSNTILNGGSLVVSHNNTTPPPQQPANNFTAANIKIEGKRVKNY
ncbi:unnamed protein product [Orchesella dallaii]|uniref:RFX-type winged-helix domain-containing protein n=1 Tax=Orchesella dallaii TaxID=48710 RepID=A0ABP1QC87_9HEXA